MSYSEKNGSVKNKTGDGSLFYKAGICEARNYPWSSYAHYDRPPAFMELSLVRSLLGGQAQYEAFINAVNEDLCMEYDGP